ncbi:MAG: LD-carboxypeptidase [Deltaproteobacteria bacterium]|nr:LD-carboxypeptidase [Deltaproteobacteria bacterium]
MNDESARDGHPKKIGIFAPSSPFDRDRFDQGLSVLETLGFSYHVHPQTSARHGYLAGDDATRLGAFLDLLKDDSIDVIMAARGGYGAHRLLEKLHLDDLGDVFELGAMAKKKLLVGFSDVTALHALFQSLGLVSIHGPVVTQLSLLSRHDHLVLAHALRHEWEHLEYEALGPIITGGLTSGRLVGGCLAVLAPLVGTRFLDWNDGVILLLEDVAEAPYRIDRMLTHLRLSGILRSVRAICVGDLVRCDAPRPDEQSIDDVLRDRLSDLGIPVVAGFPFGHGTRNAAVPLGRVALLDADARRLVLTPTRSI